MTDLAAPCASPCHTAYVRVDSRDVRPIGVVPRVWCEREEGLFTAPGLEQL